MHWCPARVNNIPGLNCMSDVHGIGVLSRGGKKTKHDPFFRRIEFACGKHREAIAGRLGGREARRGAPLRTLL